MSGMEITGYMMIVVSVLAMSAIITREVGRPIWLLDKWHEKQALPAPLFRIEEQVLQAALGESYQGYRQRVRRGLGARRRMETTS